MASSSVDLSSNTLIQEQKCVPQARLPGQQCGIPSSLLAVVNYGEDGYCSLSFSHNGRYIMHALAGIHVYHVIVSFFSLLAAATGNYKYAVTILRVSAVVALLNN